MLLGTDSLFSYVLLAQILISKRTASVKTINISKCDIPAYVKYLNLELHQTYVLKTENKYNQCSLTVYQARKSKNVPIITQNIA